MSSNDGPKFEESLRNMQPQQGISRVFAPLIFITCGFLLTIGVNLLHDGKLWAVPIAVCVGTLLWTLERLEVKHDLRVDWFALQGGRNWTAVFVVAAIAFLACLPTLNTYFLTDEFALLHAFHQLSAAQFLRLLQMDTRVFISGDARQEFRPLYSVYYAWGYHLWGLRPWAYHLCELSFHALAALLVFLIVNAIAPGNLSRAGFAGLLFAIQPPNAQTTSLIVGAVAESFPAFFYLTALLSFIYFRVSGRRWWIAISVGAFIACLLIKESAVTLPLMLFSYDLFRMASHGMRRFLREGNGKWRRWRDLIVPYTPYGILLIIYLTWRRKVLSSFLRETNWGSHVHMEMVSPVGYGTHILHFIEHIWQLQLFNFENLYPYSVPAMGVILGLLGAWTTSLFLQRKGVDRSIVLLFYFGVIWFMITNIPYVIEGKVAYHLYLPAIGLCIMVACVAFPFSLSGNQRNRGIRIFSMILLVLLSAIQMWKVDAQYARLGKMSERMASQLAVSLEKVPVGGLTVLWPANSELITSGWGEGIVPFSVQPPFTGADLSERSSLVSHPDMTCCGDAVWWQNVEPLLDELDSASPGEITVSLLSWNDKSSMFDVSSRAMPRKVLMDSVTATLGGPPDALESIDDDQATRLVKSLADLVQNGQSHPQN